MKEISEPSVVHLERNITRQGSARMFHETKPKLNNNMNPHQNQNIITATFGKVSRRLLSTLLLGAALLCAAGAAHAKTAIAVDLSGRFGAEPWGIATGDGTRPALQDLARQRCIKRGGSPDKVVVVFATNKALQGPAAFVIGMRRDGTKVAWAASGRNTTEAVTNAAALAKRDGAVAWYTAKTFVAR